MKTLLRLLLKSQHQRHDSGPAQTEKGMTLVELLVGAIMAFLIITPMLAFVVDMLNTDRREQVKSNTEQDIQAAVDFIAQDLSQAIYIYDNNPAITSTPTTTPTGIPAILNFIPPPDGIQTPILIFWKRQLLKKSLPITAGTQPAECNTNPCNDTYVLSLVAYYKIRETDSNSIWCQPSGTSCPSRIVRYQIQDGVRNPYSIDPLQRYYTNNTDVQKVSSDFNIGDGNKPGFDISKPTENVTKGASSFKNPDVRSEVLVNYIDESNPGPPVIPNECTTALGNPTTQTGTAIPESTLKITDINNINSFYACVDTARNVARVTIRGNSLRRIQTDADYKPKKSAYFPTASVQVQGLGARGQ